MDVDSRVASSHWYTMRELNQNTAKVIKEINESGEPALITRQGRPVALLTPLASTRVEAAVLSAVIESASGLSGGEPLKAVHDAEEVAHELGINYSGGYGR